jgi:hypothetical protein
VRARRDPPADATTDLARDDRDTAPRPRAAPVPTAAGRVEHWPAIPPGARSEIDNRPPPRNAKRRSGHGHSWAVLSTEARGRFRRRSRLSPTAPQLSAPPHRRAYSPSRRVDAASDALGNATQSSHVHYCQLFFWCRSARSFWRSISAGSAPTAAGGERNQFVSLRVSRRRRLRVRPPRASSAKGPRAHLVRVAEDAFQRLDETSGSLSVDHLRRLARTSSTLSTILSARARKFRSKSTR